jgi:hypothetical protein
MLTMHNCVRHSSLEITIGTHLEIPKVEFIIWILNENICPLCIVVQLANIEHLKLSWVQVQLGKLHAMSVTLGCETFMSILLSNTADPPSSSAFAMKPLALEYILGLGYTIGVPKLSCESKLQ